MGAIVLSTGLPRPQPQKPTLASIHSANSETSVNRRWSVSKFDVAPFVIQLSSWQLSCRNLDEGKLLFLVGL